MDVIRQIITYVLLLISILIVIVVLMQKAKEGGLGAAFGGDAASSLSTKGKAASKEAKLQRLTKIFAIILGVLALVMVALPRT